MNSPKFVLRPAKESDIDGVVNLRLRVDDIGVPEKNNPDFWKWENFLNPYGNSTAMIALTGREIISHIALLPRRAWVSGRSYSCALALEGMTDRRYRAKGLFPRLWFELRGLNQKNETLFLFGFPNSNSRPVFQHKFKWLDVGSPQLWLYPLRPKRLVSNRPGLFSSLLAVPVPLAGWLYRMIYRFSPSDRVEQADSFDIRFQPLLDQIHRRYPVVLERTTEYLNWRYCKAVARSYTVLYIMEDGTDEVAGYLVFRQMCHEGVELGIIMDLQVKEQESATITENLLKTALARLYANGVEAVLALTMPSDSVSACLRNKGFIAVPRRFNPNPFDLMIELCDKNLETEVLTNPLQWHLGFGDIDVF